LFAVRNWGEEKATVYPVKEANEDKKLMKYFGSSVADAVLHCDALTADKRVSIIENVCKNEFND